MFALVVLAAFGVEGNDGQQVLGVGEHFFLDHIAQFLVAEPAGVLAVVVGAGAKDEVDHFVAEVFGVGNAGRFFDFFQVFIERLAVENFTGIRVAELLILNPEIRIDYVAVENVLAVFRVRFEISGLDFLADELYVAGHQIFLDEAAVLFRFFLGKLFLLNTLLQHMNQVHRVGRYLRVVIVEYLGENLESKAGGEPGHAFIHAGHVAVLLNGFGVGIHIFQILAVVNAHL